MDILFLDAFHGGSHAAVSQGYAQHSRHSVTLLALSIAGGWRWRMRGAAITLARQLRALMAQRSRPFDLLIATDMLDLATFLGLTRDLTAHIPAAIYFHENQLTYPLPAGRPRDLAFPWINYTGALAADAVFFNSDFHRRVFTEQLTGLPGRFHDHHELDLVQRLAERATVLPPGIDLARLDRAAPAPAPPGPPIILWNSRWEYDKQPQLFFDALAALEQRGQDFRLIVAGEHIDPNAAEFVAARQRFGAHALAWGYAPSADDYARLLWQADLVVSTAAQEFFGIALIEAMYCRCMPIAPRRLSYPDLLPAHLHAACLYDDLAGLVTQLAAMLADPAAHTAAVLRSVAAQYDWAQLAPRYDAAFEQVAAGGITPSTAPARSG